ncbi:hypothetical protein GTN66_07760 [bacterium]|nr:hypothetical protein [bacterium]NIN93375.1 hypothetical protein [bacterium]NIO19152.1 hypothetical protein [bacterium]NIO74286.1 hypothetical protein [bacterium]
MKRLVIGLVITSIIFCLPLKGEAVSLKKRLGVGFSALSPLDGWSFRYWLTEKFAVNPVMGFHLETDNNTFLLGGRAIYKTKDEKSLNVYLGGEIGVDLRQNAEDNFCIGPFAGVEYFMMQLPNLGLGAEIGLYYQSAAEAFATAYGRLVVHYYFGSSEKVKEPARKPAKKKGTKKK